MKRVIRKVTNAENAKVLLIELAASLAVAVAVVILRAPLLLDCMFWMKAVFCSGLREEDAAVVPALPAVAGEAASEVERVSCELDALECRELWVEDPDDAREVDEPDLVDDDDDDDDDDEEVELSLPINGCKPLPSTEYNIYCSSVTEIPSEVYPSAPV